MSFLSSIGRNSEIFHSAPQFKVMLRLIRRNIATIRLLVWQNHRDGTTMWEQLGMFSRSDNITSVTDKRTSERIKIIRCTSHFATALPSVIKTDSRTSLSCRKWTRATRLVTLIVLYTNIGAQCDKLGTDGRIKLVTLVAIDVTWQ